MLHELCGRVPPSGMCVPTDTFIGTDTIVSNQGQEKDQGEQDRHRHDSEYVLPADRGSPSRRKKHNHHCPDIAGRGELTVRCSQAPSKVGQCPLFTAAKK
jgi:hypothetical protein